LRADGLGFIGTIHSYALRLLGREGNRIGLPAILGVMDEAQADELLEQTAKELHYKGSKKDLNEAVGLALEAPALHDGEVFRSYGRATAELVAFEFFNRMQTSGALSFDAILAFAAKLITKPDSHHVYELLVDEYQDANDLVHAICIGHDCRKFFVGDPDQAIYGFAGGNVANIIAISNYSEWEVFKLQTNYRSTDCDFAAAQRLIEKNRNDRQGDEAADRNAIRYRGISVRLLTMDSPAAESIIAEEIKSSATAYENARSAAVTPSAAEAAAYRRVEAFKSGKNLLRQAAGLRSSHPTPALAASNPETICRSSAVSVIPKATKGSTDSIAGSERSLDQPALEDSKTTRHSARSRGCLTTSTPATSCAGEGSRGLLCTKAWQSAWRPLCDLHWEEKGSGDSRRRCATGASDRIRAPTRK
jgi:hypothetical protein